MWLTANTVTSQSNVRSFAGHNAAKEEAMRSSEPTSHGTARALAKTRPGAIRTPAGPTLRRAATIAAVLMLMTVESVAARQPDAGQSSGLAASHASRMMEQADARAHPSAHRSHRKIAGPVHARSRKHVARVRAGLPQANEARRYDRPGSYFLHGTRF